MSPWMDGNTIPKNPSPQLQEQNFAMDPNNIHMLREKRKENSISGAGKSSWHKQLGILTLGKIPCWEINGIFHHPCFPGITSGIQETPLKFGTHHEGKTWSLDHPRLPNPGIFEQTPGTEPAWLGLETGAAPQG